MAGLLLAAFLVALDLPAAAQEPAPAAPQDWAEGRAVSAAAETDHWSLASGDRQQERGWLLLPKAVLFLPRMALRYLLLQPAEKLAFFVGRLQGSERFQLLLLSFYRVGFRPSAGLRLVRRFGEENQASASLTATYGGKNFISVDSDLRYELSPESRVKALFSFRQQGDKRFYGIGNQRDEDQLTRYFLEQLRAGLNLKKSWSGALTTELEAGWRRMRTSDTSDIDEDDLSLSDLFGPRQAPGFGEAQDFVVTLAQVTLDLRTDPAGRGLGLVLDGHADGYWSVGGGSFSSVLYGGSLLGRLPLFRDRVLAARILAEAAQEAGDEVPFYLLPQVGRGGTLRGYPSGRLRDRLMTVASLEYRWPLSAQGDAVLFVDAGRVFRDLEEFEFSDWKSSVGIGLRFNTRRGALLSLQLAFSSELTELLILTGDDLF
jgi:hypothetical protein